MAKVTVGSITLELTPMEARKLAVILGVAAGKDLDLYGIYAALVGAGVSDEGHLTGDLGCYEVELT